MKYLYKLYNNLFNRRLRGVGYMPIPYWLKILLARYPMQQRVIAYCRLVEGQKAYSGVPQELGCASAVSRILEMVDSSFFGGANTVDQIVSTIVLANEMESSKRFVELNAPIHGCIVINATDGRNIGHCGIYDGATKRIYNNNSATGAFIDSYSLLTWKLYFEGKKGLRTRYFFPLADY